MFIFLSSSRLRRRQTTARNMATMARPSGTRIMMVVGSPWERFIFFPLRPPKESPSRYGRVGGVGVRGTYGKYGEYGEYGKYGKYGKCGEYGKYVT